MRHGRFSLIAGGYGESVVASESELVKLDGVSLQRGRHCHWPVSPPGKGCLSTAPSRAASGC